MDAADPPVPRRGGGATGSRGALLTLLTQPLGYLLLAAVEMVPEPVRSLSQLRSRGLRPGEARWVRMLGGAAAWLPLPSLPPALAARRMRGAR